MPFPWELEVAEDGGVRSTASNPLIQQQQVNNAELAAVGAIDPAIAAAVQRPDAGPSMFPPGLAPASVSAEGLPDYLTNPTAYVNPPGGPAGLNPDGTVPDMHLSAYDEARHPRDVTGRWKKKGSGVGSNVYYLDIEGKDATADVSFGAAYAPEDREWYVTRFQKGEEPDLQSGENLETADSLAQAKRLAESHAKREVPGLKLAQELDLAESHKLKCPKCDTVQSAKNKKCTNCGHDLAEARKAKFAKLNAGQDRGEWLREHPDATHQAVIYNVEGLNLAVEGEDGYLWKVACKTGTLALSPGPGQTDSEKPLVLTDELFDDMVLSAEEKAFPYITVPETHSNGSLENTGYVRAWEVLDRDKLLADSRLPEKHRPLIEGDPEDTRYLLAGIEFTEPDVKAKAERGSIPDTSIGVKFNYRNKRTGKLFRAAWEHLALTPMPWVDGLVPFGLSQTGKPFNAEEAFVSYDGVYVPLELGIQARVTADGNRYEWDITNIDPDQVRADIEQAITVIDDDSKLELPFGVCVQRYDEYWVVNNDYDKIAGIRQDQGEAVDLAMATLKAKYNQERDRRAAGNGEAVAAYPGKQLPPWPEGKSDTDGYSQQPHGEDQRRANATLELDQDAPVVEDADLSRSDDSASLPSDSEHPSQTGDTEDTMPRTVEELLAEQQAELEASQRRIAELEQTNLSLSGQVSTQGQQLHTDAVAKRVRKLQQAGYPPVLCLAVKAVMEGDKSRLQLAAEPDENGHVEGGLNLSISQPVINGGEETIESKVLQSPTDIVEFLLSAMPLEKGNAAATLASVHDGLDELALSQHEDKNDDESRKQAVDQWERERHPERFKDGGKGERL